MRFYQIIHHDLQKIKGQVVSIIGGGGKSSLLEKIGRELAKENLKVILTSTTKLQPIAKIGFVLTEEQENFESELRLLMQELNIALVARGYYKGERLKGVGRRFVPHLTSYADVVLVEADGCRQRSLKTHKDYEPPIPPISTTVIIVCGANAVGAGLNEKNVHRDDLFAAKWSLKRGTKLTPEIIGKELLSPRSYLRNIPIHAAVRYFVNKADSNEVGAKLLSEHLMRKSHYPVFVGSIKENSLMQVSEAQLLPT